MHEAVLSEDLAALNRIAEALNRETDVRGALDAALSLLVELMGLQTGWILLAEDAEGGQMGEVGFAPVAHCHLPPGLAPEKAEVWRPRCACLDLLRDGSLTEAYTEVACTRLANARGDRRGLTVHASAPVISGSRKLGILNVAAQDWSAFTPRSLAFLSMVGNQIGIALERALLFELVRDRRIKEQAALLVFSNQLLSGIDREDLTRLLVSEVTTLLEADACSLLLLDERANRLEFVAATGWRDDPVERELALQLDVEPGPARVMRAGEPLLVDDLQAGNGSTWSPTWQREEGFRGQALIPLVVEERSIGILVLNSREPRTLDEDDLRLLQLMANQAALAIEKARLHREALELLRVEQELAVGTEMQRSLLPAGLPQVAGYQFAVSYQAAREVGGDFYDFCWMSEGEELGVIIGDVSGKGIPAALFMAMSRTNIRAAVLSGRSPAVALMRANELILKDGRESAFCSAVYAKLDPEEHSVTYANGGHNKPLLIRCASSQVIELPARGIVLGEFPQVAIQEHTIDIEPGDVLVLYTDGVTEAFDAAGHAFGEDRLSAVLASCAGQGAQAVVAAIREAVSSFVGAEPQADDFTMVALSRDSSS